MRSLHLPLLRHRLALWLAVGVAVACMGMVASSCGTPRQAEQSAPALAQVRKPVSQSLSGDSESALSARRQRRFNELFLEAICQKETDRIDAEYELLEAALRIAPHAPEAVYEMAVLKLSYATYSDSVSKAEGDSLLHLAVRLAPGNLYYKETLGEHLANSSRYVEAIRLYEEIAEEKPSEEMLGTLIWLYKTSGDYAGAIRAIERLERVSGRNESLSLEKFQTYLAMKDNERAYKAIEDLCAEYPLDLRYRVLLGDLYDQHGYHERALDIYRDVLAAEPDNSFAQLSLLAYYKAARADSLYRDLLGKVVLNPRTQGEARLEAMRSYAIDNINHQGDTRPVISLFRAALAKPQENRDVAELYAYYLSAIRAPQDSVVPVLRQILEIEPDNAKARLQWLQIVLRKGDMAQAVQICRDGVLYDPGEITFYYYEGEAQYRLGHDNASIEALERGTARVDDDTDPRLASDLYALLGDVLYNVRRHEEAYAAYEQAIAYNALNLLCLNNYAYYLAQNGRQLDKAEEMSRRTIEAEPENATYLDTYAWVLFKQRQYAYARSYAEEMLRYAGQTAQDASLYDHAADIYYHAGQRKEAVQLWRKALSLTDEPQLKRRLKQKIARRRP